MLVSFPAELYGAKVLAEAPSRKVLSFSPLPEGVRQQTVGKGTDFGELNLPDTLTAVCIPLENGSAAAGGTSGKFSDISVVSGKGLEKQASTDITPGDGTGTAGNEETTGNEESTGITGNEENTESTGEEDYTSNTDNVGNEEEVPAGPENFGTGAVEEETLAIGPVTWASLPEYNGGTEGTYTFFPTLPENYQLSGQAELPKITVTVQKAGKSEGNQRDHVTKRKSKEDSAKKKTVDKSIAEEELELLTSGEVEQAAETDPACGEIKEDTIWGDGELTSGTLTVDSGVTLTVNGTVNITGEVTIQGGGTVARGTATASFEVNSGQGLNLYGVTLDGKSIPSTNSFVKVNQGSLLLGQGCVVQNVIGLNENDIASPIYIEQGATGTLQDAAIKNCSSDIGGGILSYGNLTINGGTYQNNKASIRGGFVASDGGGSLVINGGEFSGNISVDGGCIYSNRNLTINGGNFSGNTASSDVSSEENPPYVWGGCIYSIGNTEINGGTYQNNRAGERGGAIAVFNNGNLLVTGGNFISNTSKDGGAIYTYCYGDLAISGGYFEGNTSQEGVGGAIYHGLVSRFSLSGDVRFFGNGDPYADSICVPATDDKIYIDGPLSYPLNIFVQFSKDGRVVIRGNGNYKIQNKDLKKIHIFDCDNKTKWYRRFDEEKNEIYITQTAQPQDTYNIFYDSNRAQGTAPEDEKDYQSGEYASIKSGGTLSLEGYTFDGWNTKRDGTGKAYQAGESILMTEDLTLYAIFQKNAENTAITVDFYSREAGKMETITAETGDSQGSGTILAPQLQEMPGWMPVGWSTSPEGFAGDIAAGSEITVTEDTAYYGVYQKEVCLSYQGNGARTVPGPELKISYANVHQEITYSIPSFTIASAPDYSGAAFQGWNTKEDGGGETYPAGSTQQLGNSTILYAIWGKAPEGNPDNIPEEKPEEPKEPVQYTVEHYKQELEGDGYVKEEGDTEVLLGEKGTAVEAKAKDYSGFSLNASHPLGKVSGTAEEGLVLKMYYDRDIYEIAFDLNGGHGTAPETQKIRWGGLLGEVPDPERAGYHFKGWYLEENGLDLGLWDFGHPVENNTGNLHTTLYAMWADETAPVLGEASYSTGHKDFLNWIIQKESIIISVLVTEEGSGLAKAEYVLAAEDETEKEGLAQIEEKRGQAENSMAYGSSGFVIRALQGAAETGTYEAIVTVEEEFKGKVYLTCTDKEGNQSAQKIITSLGGGIIVEDNAPEISFSNTKEKIAGKDIKANVRIEDAKDGSVSGGIAKVFYQLDGAEKITLPKKNFQKELVETYQFKVKVSGAGEHTLKVTAVDNAGNRNTRQVSLRISKEKKDEAEKESPEETDGSKTDGTPIVPEIPGGGNRPGGSGWPSGTEPKTGDSTHIKIYATVAMIAGFSYLLLYFEGEHGITEQEKEEIVYRLVSWAKKGGTARRMLGLAAIFFFLAYYHSIGKSVPVEWREVYQCKS